MTISGTLSGGGSATGPAQLTVVLYGYGTSAFVLPSAGLRYVPVTPCRVADTRNSTGPFGGPTLGGGTSRDFVIPNSACGIPSTAAAYSLNVAVVPAGPLGYLTVWPTGEQQPLVATLNSVDGRIKSNAAIVPAGTNGQINLLASNDTDLVVDINGYFAPAGIRGLSLYVLPPCRVLDTRQPAGSQPFNGAIDVNVPASACGVSAGAQGFVFNATVVPSGPLGYLTVWPQGTKQPIVATLNAVDGAVTSNSAIVPTTNGSVTVFASNPTFLVLDIFGYFGL